MPTISTFANGSARGFGFAGAAYSFETAGGLLVYSTAFYSGGREYSTAFWSDYYTWTVPAGVTQISAVSIGAGGGGAQSQGTDAGAGGAGGGLSYINSFSVTPGQQFRIYAGRGGYDAFDDEGPRGYPSGIVRVSDSAVILKAIGGGGCFQKNTVVQGGQASDGVGDVKYSGGIGDTGGLTAGGDGGASASYTANGPGGSSGNGLGISVYGNIRVGRTDNPVNPDDGGEYGGAYGGGATGADDEGSLGEVYTGGRGGSGAVRIIWNTDPQSPRQFPGVNVGLDFSGGNETTVTIT